MMQDPTIFAWDMLNEPRCDCFPITIPPPEDDVSCRLDCALKMQVSASMTSRGFARSAVTNRLAGQTASCTIGRPLFPVLSHGLKPVWPA